MKGLAGRILAAVVIWAMIMTGAAGAVLAVWGASKVCVLVGGILGVSPPVIFGAGLGAAVGAAVAWVVSYDT